jgi:2-dehydropantoate 2-reductase
VVPIEHQAWLAIRAGGYFGGRLAQGGADVAFIAQGAHLAALRKDGLRVRSKLGDLHLPKVLATDDPRTLGRVDFVLMGVKLLDTEAAAHAVAPLVSGETAVVSFQNGVEKDDVLRSVLGDAAIMGGGQLHRGRHRRTGCDRSQRDDATTRFRRV